MDILFFCSLPDLKCVDEDVEQHHAGGDELRPGAEQEAEKGAEGGFDGGHGVFVRDDELCDEGAQEGAHDHPDGRDDEAREQADDGAHAAGLGAAGKFREVGGNDIIDDGYHNGNRQPDQEEGQGHSVAAAVCAAAPQVDDQQAHPTQGRSGQTGRDASDDADQAQKEGQYGDKGFHFAKILIIFVGNKNLTDMFAKEVYARRRQTLLEKMRGAGERGVILLVGNAEAPAQYRDNCYKWRQDSTWLYYMGLDDPMYAAVLDIDSGEEVIYADDVEIGDIIWMGPQPTVQSKAERVGVAKSAPYAQVDKAVKAALKAGRKVHYVAPSRYFNTLRLMEMLGRKRIDLGVSEALTKAVISMRLIKEDVEIAAIDAACDLGFKMHSVARDSIRLGIVEQDIVGKMEGVALAEGWGVSFPTILTQHGETLHNHIHDKVIEPGKLMVIDAGVESNEHYASDFTRTYPTTGKFTPKQRDVYQIVCDCNELAFSLVKPGITYREVHLATARKMLEGLSALGLVRGDLDEMVALGIAGLFQPHGLGHNMGLDVHDMEDLNENWVGYDPDQTRAKQLGLGSLRMARRLRPGHVITDEPGIYFIPALIEQWKQEGTGKDFVNFDKLESYYDFGGIRLEDDVLVTLDGARRLGAKRLPIHPDDVEKAMAR